MTWVEVGSRVRVRKVEDYGAARTFEGVVTGCWDFAAVEVDGKTEHVMPAELVEVLASPPPAVAPAPATGPRPWCRDCGRTLIEGEAHVCPPKVPREEPESCPKCGSGGTSAAHRAGCLGAPCKHEVGHRHAGPLRACDERCPERPTKLSNKGKTYPKCTTCGRAVVNGRHVCRTLARSHRHPETDALPRSPTSTAPTRIDVLPFPVEGVEFSCKVSSELNLSRWHWRGRRARSREQRRAVHDALAAYATLRLPAEITITRTGWNPLDEHDNLRLACKSVVDAIAEWLGVDDRDDGVTWLYAQKVTRDTEVVESRKGPVRQAVNRIRVQIRGRAEGPRTVPCVCADVATGQCIQCHGKKCLECRQTGRCSKCHGLGIVDDPRVTS